MKIYLATWLYEPQQGEALTKSRQWQRLVSFFHVRDTVGDVVRYVTTGRNPKQVAE